ncbi:MAG: hypothetical protein AAGC88_09975 [Bacteroidota bacterium]
MRSILVFIILAFCGSANGQYVSAIIKDPDGYTNVRKDSSSNSMVVDKILEGEVFTYNGDSWYEEKNWIGVAINRTNNRDKCKYLSTMWEGGYMHKSRVHIMSEMPNNFRRSITDSSVQLIGDNFHAKIDVRNLSQNEIDTLSEDACIWGTDLGNPQNVISGLQLTAYGILVSVPSKEYEDLYKVTLDETYIKTYMNFIYIIMSNSSGAGFYEIIWVFKDGIYQRRYINIAP